MAPDIPTTAEAGFPRVVNALRFLLLVPAGTPRDIVATLHAAMAGTLNEPALRDQLTRGGFDVTISTPEEALAMLRAEHDRWAEILPALNLRLD